MDQADRRRDLRHEIELQLEFCPSGDHGTPVALTGVTRNVSPGGVYFHTDRGACLRADSQLAIRIAIPNSTEDPIAPLALSGRAKVVRIDELRERSDCDGPVFGVAVRFDDRPSIRTGYDFWLADKP